jgi:hypothetical protein
MYAWWRGVSISTESENVPPSVIDSYRRFLGERFAPLKPLLDTLQPIVHRDGWPRNNLGLGRVLLVVDYFKQVVGEWNS